MQKILYCFASSHHFVLFREIKDMKLECFQLSCEWKLVLDIFASVYAWQLSWAQFQVFEIFCPVMCLKVKQTLCPCFLQKGFQAVKC